MFGFIKKVFAVITTFFNLSYVNSLECVSMSIQECKARRKLININANEPAIYPYSIKVNKCSVRCDDINDPYTKLCVPDVAKNINAKVFNLMQRINETRHIIWHETCKCVCKLASSARNNRQRFHKDKCRRECKEDLNNNETCDKGFIWNPSNCECECDKSCGIGEYLDYKNCVCRSSLVDKLIEECANVIDENKIFNETLNVIPLNIISSDDCASCTLYVVLFAVFLTASVIIGGAFVYFYWHSKKDIVRQYFKKNNVSIKFNPFKKANY